jgi:phospholipase D1/2
LRATEEPGARAVMENGNNGGNPPHYPPYQYPYPQAQAQLYPYGYQYPPAPPSPSPSAAPAGPYLSPSPSFPSYAPAPHPPQQFHSGPLQAYPPPPQYHAYPPPPHPSPYGHGYDPYPSPYFSYPSTNPSPSPSPGLSPSSSFHHQHASAPEPPSPAPSAPSAPSYPIEDVLASMRLSGRHDYASSPSVTPPSTPFLGDGSSHGGGMQLVPYGTAAGGSQHGGGMQVVPYGAAAGGSQHGGSFRASLKVVLLHGSLDIWVHDARHLPNKDMFSKRVGELLGPRITSAVGSKMSSASMTSDPYVTVQVSYATVARTYVIPNCENPVWSQNFMVPVGHEAAEVQFVVKDSDVFGAQIIGVVSIPAEKLLTGDRIQGVFPVLEPNGKPCAPGAVLHLSIQLIPVAQLTMYHHGVIAGPDSHGVPHTYFPLRRGMRVTLYQDAHVPDGCLPDIWLSNGLRYQHGQCWRDIYDAICQARKLIYIVGWSVFHTIHLVRDGTQAPSLGDLLKMKSQEGVRVLLLVWDDPTSRSILGYKMVCNLSS